MASYFKSMKITSLKYKKSCYTMSMNIFLTDMIKIIFKILKCFTPYLSKNDFISTSGTE